MHPIHYTHMDRHDLVSPCRRNVNSTHHQLSSCKHLLCAVCQFKFTTKVATSSSPRDHIFETSQSYRQQALFDQKKSNYTASIYISNTEYSVSCNCWELSSSPSLPTKRTNTVNVFQNRPFSLQSNGLSRNTSTFVSSFMRKNFGAMDLPVVQKLMSERTKQY